MAGCVANKIAACREYARRLTPVISTWPPTASVGFPNKERKMSNKLISAEFHGEPINIIEHAGKRWLTSDAVGKCLGYTAGEERRAILKLYKRHRDEFTDQDTEVVSLATRGGLQQTRIFSDTGCIKLGFFAKTKIGKEFRNFVSDKLATANMEAALHQPTQQIGRANV